MSRILQDYKYWEVVAKFTLTFGTGVLHLIQINHQPKATIIQFIYDCHHNTKVKPKAATADFEILMMVGKTPETC
jgi:hypothetical protein